MGWFRLDILKLLLLALPALALNFLLLEWTPTFSRSPEQTAWILIPLLLVIVGMAVWLRRDSTLALGRGFLIFFLLLCLFFSLATASEVLTGKRVLLAGNEQTVPRTFLGLSRLGDWHYWFAAAGPPVDDMVVVTFPSFAGELRAEIRRRFAFVINQSIEHGARGLAFDYYFETESDSDALLKRSIAAAADRRVPVLFGYRHLLVDGQLQRQPLVTSLVDAIAEGRQGHLSGYRESDGRVRMVPMGFAAEGAPEGHRLTSLSQRIAESLHGGPLPPPANRLLQYTRPRFGLPVVEFSPDMDWGIVRDRFVLVGSASATDRLATPYGDLQGVEIHAFAANSLRSGQDIRRMDPRFMFPLLFAGCYSLTVLYVRGFSGRRLLLSAAALSTALIAGAAWAIHSERIWVDVSYPLAGLWLLTLLLLAIRAVRLAPAGGRPAVIDREAPLPESDFDVFLSHNSQDKPQARELRGALVVRGLKPWLDERELAPGRSWQEGLEAILLTVRSTAVLVGAAGLGPWEKPEVRVSLSENVRRGLPVIPVLLPGAPRSPVLPLFLTQFTWVDLRNGITESGIDRLVWGVTGVKPDSEG